MKTQYYAASSLDGFIAAPHNSLDWLLQFGDVESTSYPSLQYQNQVSLALSRLIPETMPRASTK